MAKGYKVRVKRKEDRMQKFKNKKEAKSRSLRNNAMRTSDPKMKGVYSSVADDVDRRKNKRVSKMKKRIDKIKAKNE